MSNKSIDINQRIPLDTLFVALESYLDDNYSDDYILEQLRLEFKGENRLKKALRIVNKIVLTSPLKTLIDENKDKLKLAIKKKTDRNIILMALLNTAFPFSFDVLSVFGKYFIVQDIISSEVIKKSISNVYGGNRATENGIYSVVPMFLEANFFSRPKQGIYKMSEKMAISNLITKELYVASYKINKGIEEIQEYELLDPYFNFIEI